MFSHTVGFLFSLLMVSFAMQKLLSMMQSHLFIFFIALALGDVSAKKLLWEMSEILLPMFSSRVFMVSWLTFKSFMHFEFIFVYGVSGWSSFIFFNVPVQFSLHHLLKGLSLLHFMLLPPLSNTNWLWRHELMSGFSVLFHWSIYLFLCQYQCIFITMAL